MTPDFSQTYADWMAKATTFWNGMSATWHTALSVAVGALIVFIILDIVKGLVKTGVRVLLIFVAVGLAGTTFPWLGASLLALFDQAWQALRTLG
ncbi:MAG: hypothetical protein LBI33_01855 [Propionibacteriaceae bacterium]|jgi:uncharacterized membrane protein YGL010W|nr:hypothetical protein [Propionibacteriaceae bacterium]